MKMEKQGTKVVRATQEGNSSRAKRGNFCYWKHARGADSFAKKDRVVRPEPPTSIVRQSLEGGRS